MDENGSLQFLQVQIDFGIMSMAELKQSKPKAIILFSMVTNVDCMVACSFQ